VLTEADIENINKELEEAAAEMDREATEGGVPDASLMRSSLYAD
jgi:hypothetical protein